MNVEVGQKIRGWTVIDATPIRRNRARYVKCRCACGTEREVQLMSLKHGTSSRCRICTENERYSASWLSRLSERMSSAKQRCCDPKAISYKNYGALGVWFRFKTVREAVLWVAEHLGPPPDGKSLDRIDPYGHYEPGNLRWASAKEQQANRKQFGCRWIRPTYRFVEGSA